MEFIAEFIIEVFGEIFSDTIGSKAESAYVPKWIRILIITVIAGALFTLVWFVSDGKIMPMAVFGGITVFAWLCMLVRVMKIKTKKYETAVIDENRTYLGKRSILGSVSGTLDLSNLGHWVGDNKNVRILFSKADSLKGKDKIVRLMEKETEFLRLMSQKTEREFNYIGNQARTKLMEKLKNQAVTNNGTKLKLTEIRFEESERSIEEGYLFKDGISGKKVYVQECKALNVYDMND